MVGRGTGARRSRGMPGRALAGSVPRFPVGRIRGGVLRGLVGGGPLRCGCLAGILARFAAVGGLGRLIAGGFGCGVPHRLGRGGAHRLRPPLPHRFGCRFPRGFGRPLPGRCVGRGGLVPGGIHGTAGPEDVGAGIDGCEVSGTGRTGGRRGASEGVGGLLTRASCRGLALRAAELGAAGLPDGAGPCGIGFFGAGPRGLLRRCGHPARRGGAGRGGRVLRRGAEPVDRRGRRGPRRAGTTHRQRGRRRRSGRWLGACRREPAGSAAGPAGRTAPGVGCVVGGVDAADAGAAGGVDPGPGKPKGGVPEAAEPEGPGTVEADGRMGPAAGAAWSSGSGKGVSEVVRAVPSGRHVVHAVKPSSRASS